MHYNCIGRSSASRSVLRFIKHRLQSTSTPACPKMNFHTKQFESTESITPAVLDIAVLTDPFSQRSSRAFIFAYDTCSLNEDDTAAPLYLGFRQ